MKIVEKVLHNLLKVFQINLGKKRFFINKVQQ